MSFKWQISPAGFICEIEGRLDNQPPATHRLEIRGHDRVLHGFIDGKHCGQGMNTNEIEEIMLLRFRQ